MKKLSIGLSLLLTAFVGVVLIPSAATTPEEFVAVSSAPVAVEPVTASCSAPTSNQQAATESSDEPNGACYPWQPSCSRNSQCDAWCGQKGWGVCSHWCCLCLG